MIAINGSTIITSQVPIDRWPEVIVNPTSPMPFFDPLG